MIGLPNLNIGVQIVIHANHIHQPSKPLGCGRDASNARPSMLNRTTTSEKKMIMNSVNMIHSKMY